MLLNVILGFVIPVVIGCWILRKSLKLLLIFFPFGVATSTVFNNIGFNYFWRLEPEFTNRSFSALPFDLGLFPMAGCLMIYYVNRHRAHPWLAAIVSALILTIVEWISKENGKVSYFNGWNIIWSYVSYLVPMVMAYLYSLIFFKVFKARNPS
ncbi:CBO0543 family protein [Paenibacillus xylanexedens]|uniref:CBO0543 family protein n=1 Tax=Paenibacillus xylanexedens TaxID=528191 RepID=UPI0011A22FF5|nr:CBO0543 family protein [Paenibacillus xylanexedens]